MENQANPAGVCGMDPSRVNTASVNSLHFIAKSSTSGKDDQFGNEEPKVKCSEQMHGSFPRQAGETGTTNMALF